MCAIGGIADLFWDDEILKKMLSTMKRRGPDGEGKYMGKDRVLLHSRLAVMDPKKGAQPMQICWEGEKLTLVYNGELYNAPELRRELEQLGHTFATNCDTEVLLRAYAQWKENCLHKLNGIYAFAVLHHNNGKLFLARDRMGVKPFFYSLIAGGFVFGSEIKTILAHPLVKPELDQDGAAQLLLLGPGRKPGSGVLKGICELEPGWCAIYQDGKLNAWQYWKLTDGEHRENFEETAQQVRALVLDAIRRQTASNVPLGTFLSGGLDSSIITAVCADLLATEEKNLPTFSLDYSGNAEYFKPGAFQPSSDNAYIQLIGKDLPVEVNWTTLQWQELLDALEESTQARDLPGMADVDFSLLLFCARIKEKVTVVLSGECADEIFGGYPWFTDPKVRAVAGFPWAQNTALRAELLHPDWKRGLDPKEYVNDLYQMTLDQSHILPGTSPEEVRIKHMVNLNYRWFMQTLLDRKDRMSMYSGLEVRVPFCDHRIAQYLYRIPWEMKHCRGIEKGLLRYAMRDLLNEQVLWRKKSPYPKTYHPAYTQAVGERFAALLADPTRPVFAIADHAKLMALQNLETPWPWYGQLMAKPQTMAYFLQMDHWLSSYHISV